MAIRQLIGLVVCLLVGPGVRLGQTQATAGTILQISLIEGDGAVHRPGSKSSTPLTVQITDAIGQPVSEVTVTFLMPGDGPAGVFASGLSTEVLNTGADGRASVHGIRWGRSAGTARIRVTARKGDARAGTFSMQYIEEAAVGKETGGKKPKSVSKRRGKWIAVAMIAAGAAAGGLALGVAGSGGSTVGAPPPVSGGVQEPPGAPSTIQIGTPAISIGAP